MARLKRIIYEKTTVRNNPSKNKQTIETNKRIRSDAADGGAAAIRSQHRTQLVPLASDPACELHILRKDRYTLGVDRTQIGIFK